MMPYCRPEGEAPFMRVVEEPWRPGGERVAPQECPHVARRECAFRLTPEVKSDWWWEVQRLRVQRPRCILLALPAQAVNLTVADLRLWVAEAQALVPEIPVFMAQEGCRFPCGERAACLQCPQSAARLLQEQSADWAEREVPIAAQLHEKFPQLNERKRAVVVTWALEPSTTNANLPITVTEIGKRLKVNRSTIWRWLQEAMEAEPELMRRLETFRERRLRKTGAYQVDR